MRLVLVLFATAACRSADPESLPQTAQCDKPVSDQDHTFVGAESEADALAFCEAFSGGGPDTTIVIDSRDFAVPVMDCVCTGGAIDVLRPASSTVELPLLTDAGSLNVRFSSAGGRVSLPRLVRVDRLAVGADEDGPIAVEAPELVSADELNFTSQLEVFPDLPSIVQVDSLSLFMPGQPADIAPRNFPAANLSIFDDGQLTRGGVPCFEVTGSATLVGFADVDVLELPICSASLESLTLRDIGAASLQLPQPMAVTVALELDEVVAPLPTEIDLDGIESLFVHGQSSILPKVGAERLEYARLDDQFDLTPLDEIEHIGRLTIYGDGQTQPMTGLNGLDSVGTLYIDGSYSNLDGFQALRTAQTIEIRDLDGLNEITTFRALREVDDLIIQNNSPLKSLTGLFGLERVGILRIWSNSYLPTREAEALRDAIDDLESASISFNQD